MGEESEDKKTKILQIAMVGAILWFAFAAIFKRKRK